MTSTVTASFVSSIQDLTGGSDGEGHTCSAGDLGRADPLEKAMATHSILAWRIPGTEEPGGLESVGSQSQTRLTD